MRATRPWEDRTGAEGAWDAPRAPADLVPRVMAEVRRIRSGSLGRPAAPWGWLAVGGSGLAATVALAAASWAAGHQGAALGFAGAAVGEGAAVVAALRALVATAAGLQAPLIALGTAVVVVEALALRPWLRPTGR